MSTQSKLADANRPRPWPAERIELWPIERLIPYANNARRHSEADLDKLAASIRKWGWTTPVLVDEEGNLLAGHGRIAAAPRAGVTSIPVIVARGWSEEEKVPIAWPTISWRRGRAGISSSSATSSRSSGLPASTSA